MVGAVCLLLGARAHAAEYRVTPMSVTATATTATGVNTSNVIEMVRDGKGVYVEKNVGVSSATLGNLAKGVLKRGAGAAGAYFLLKDLVNGAGWLLDELKQEVQVPGQREELGAWAWCIANNAGRNYCAATASGICATSGAIGGIECVRTCQREGDDSRGWLRLQTQDDVNFSGTGCAYASALAVRENRPASGWGDWASETAPRPVTAAELGDLLRRHLEAATAVLRDAQGRPIMTPELTEAINALRRAMEAANGDQPNPDAQADNLENPNTDGRTTEWPSFCGWAEKVCEWIDWTKKPHEKEEVEVPEEELDLETPGEWSSGLGEGTCPPPWTVPITLGPQVHNIDFTYQPLCDLASLLRPLLIACAAIVAAFIIGGAKRA